MPDNDLNPRRTRRHWHRPCAAMIGDQDLPVVGHEIDRAITATLREQPLLSPHALVHEMCEAAKSHDDARFQAALTRYGREAGLAGMTTHVLSQATAMMELGRAGLDTRSEAEVADELVRGTLRRFANASLCGADDVTKAMLAEGATFNEVRDRQEACLDAAQYEASAAQILSDEGSAPRTPRSRVPKPPLVELLNQKL
jgi:hypothetical protein